MLTPEEKKAMKEWRESQMTEEDRLLRKAKERLRYAERKKRKEERGVLNGWKK